MTDIALKIYWSSCDRLVAKKVFLHHVVFPALRICRFQILSNFVNIIIFGNIVYQRHDTLNQRDYRTPQLWRPIVPLH